MHVSLVICLALVIAVVNCAPAQTSKARKPQSAYAYLRSVRGKKSCASGTCPFWERHGRSFAALRCYSQQYKECVCLHRMCFSSCLFTRQQCNSEMVICLKQICPRCMPASSSSMCQVYDSMAERVADALSVFSCYACCPNLANSPSNNSNNAGGNLITTTPRGNGGNAPSGNTNNAGGAGSTTRVPSNAGAGTNNGGAGPNAVNGGRPNNANGARPNNANGARPNNANGARPNNANGARPNNANGARPNNPNGNTGNFGGVIPGSGAANIAPNLRNNSNTVNNPNARPNQNQNQNQNPNQQVRQVTRPTTKRPATTRRKTVTTRRPAATTTTRRSNTNKNTTRKPVNAQ